PHGLDLFATRRKTSSRMGTPVGVESMTTSLRTFLSAKSPRDDSEPSRPKIASSTSAAAATSEYPGANSQPPRPSTSCTSSASVGSAFNAGSLMAGYYPAPAAAHVVGLVSLTWITASVQSP